MRNLSLNKFLLLEQSFFFFFLTVKNNGKIFSPVGYISIFFEPRVYISLSPGEFLLLLLVKMTATDRVNNAIVPLFV